MALPKLTLVLGGAASGKSAYAEALVLQSNLEPFYIATAQAFDDEMKEKILRHQAMRSDLWTTIEAPIDLSAPLANLKETQAVLIDCATLWLTNVILGEYDVDDAQAKLLAALTNCPSPVVIVSNEVGQGIVPDNALSRRFRNAQGQLNQALAAQADRVVAVMAGLPLELKAAP